MTSVFKRIYRIFKEGLGTLFFNIDGVKRSKVQALTFLLIIPLIVLFVSVLLNVNIESIIDTLISSLSIFTALIFGVLFIAPEKLNQRIVELKSKYRTNDEIEERHRNYLVRFLNFTRLFIKQVSFLILISILLIILLIVQKMNLLYWVSICLSAISIVVSYYFVIYFLFTLINIYSLLMDDINRVEKEIRGLH